MKIRGERECRDCGSRWSYFETGSVACPDCGSVRSTGVGDRERHTDGVAELDLADARSAATRESLEAAADTAADACRDYVRTRGFVDAGELRPLDDVYLAAQELVHAASLVRTRMTVDEVEETYVLELLEGAESGERPDPDAVPRGMRAARGLGAATAVRDYRDEIRTYLGPKRSEVASLLETVGEHVTRIRAIDGDVPPEDGDGLIEAVRAIGEAVRTGEEEPLETATSTLEDLR
ncbi:MAG: TFIIB-type zinc ribbon-containing protein [Halanaeroarchaeum sp.]